MEPSRLGPYSISRRLGRGGMGMVYEAVAPDGQRVALKTLATHLGAEPGLKRRFEAEIEALKGLRHPGIVRLLAFGEENGVPYFAMELVAGRSLEEILAAGRTFSWRETVSTATAIARALKAAHDQGIVHRDLKPANLLFAAEEAADGGVKLADFGIARLFGEAGQTLAGTVVGTAEYMAPEQAAGSPVDQRGDLYSLGLVIYAMLVGRPPFRGGDLAEVLRRQRRETPPPVSALGKDLPPALDRLIERLLAKEPAARPANALAVLRALAGIAAEPPEPAAGVDLLAVTRGIEADEAPPRGTAAAGTGRPELAATLQFAGATAAAAGQSLAHRPTVPAPGGDAPRPPAANRFTTVAELDRVRQAEADRQRRRERWGQLLAGAGLVLALTVLAYAATRPVSPDALHDRIMAIADNPAADLRDARRWIDTFLARHGDDPRAEAVQGLSRTLAIDALERQARRRARGSAPGGPIERDYRSAMAREAESPVACLSALEAILAVHAAAAAAGGPDSETALWLAVVRRHIDRLAPAAAREREEDSGRVAAGLATAESLAAEARAKPAFRTGLEARRRELLAGIVEIYGTRPHVAEAVAEARRLLEEP
jgi:hypothetical protein